jgi:superfamily II DNA or RNA helicase
MQFEIHNCYTQATSNSQEELDLLRRWCTKDYEYYGMDWSVRPPRRSKKKGNLRYYHQGRFPSGWAGIFINKFKAANIPVTWKDSRETPATTHSIIHGSKAGSVPPLRDYQQEALDICLDKGRGIIHHATGAGKTVVIAKVIEKLGLPSIVIVPTINLLLQTEAELAKFLGEDNVGGIGDNRFEPSTVTVSTIQSLWSKLKNEDPAIRQIVQDCKVLLIDEAHHINVAGKDKIQNTYFQIAQLIDAYYRFGFTATPGDEGSLDRELLMAATGRVLHHVSSSELIKRGLLTRPVIEMYKIDCPNRFSDWQLAYRENILRNAPRNSLITRLAEQYAAEGKSILIIVTRVQEHGSLLNDLIEDAVFMSGETPSEERKQILEDFSNKDLKILISTVVNEGVNIPSMDVIIMAGGGKSNKLTVQRVGRALRKAEGKETAKIIDFYDNDNGILLRHSKARLKTYRKEEEFQIEPLKEANNV